MDRGALSGQQASEVAPAPFVVLAPSDRLDRERDPVAVEGDEVQAGGGERAAKRSLKTKLVAQITDYEAALAHFKDADDVRNAVAALAQRAVKAGMREIPGVKIVEEASL